MKKKSFLLLSTSVMLLSFKTIAPSSWALDDVHSNLGFSITHLMVSDVEGSFKIKEATITAPNDDFSDASVYMLADVKTVNTGNEERDEHLRKPDILDAEKYPTLTFKSNSFKKVSDKKYAVKGDLTLHGVTKPITLDAMARVGTNPMNNKPIAGFKVTGKIKRSDFGISPSTPDAILSDEVAIEANVEFAKNELQKN